MGAGGGMGGARDKELTGDWRNGVVTTNHPTAKRSPPPWKGGERLCRGRESGVRDRVENTTHLVNQKLPVLPEEGGTGAQRSVGW